MSEGTKVLESKAFSESRLESVTLPAALREIRDAFYGCERLRTVVLPTGKMDVHYDRKKHCFSGKFTVAASTRELLSHPAYDYFGVKEVAFEENCRLEVIGPNAFQGAGIERFDVPPSLREIGVLAFGNCRRLKSVHLNERLEKLGELCFWGTQVRETDLLDVCDHIANIEKAVFTSARELVLPQGLKAVGKGWFAGSAVETVTIPRSVEVLETGAFEECKNLKTVVFEEGSRLEWIRERCFSRSGLEELRCPPRLRGVGPSAFCECFSLRSVVFGDRVSEIGRCAF